MRKLASIQRIKDISPIEGADRIEQIKVLGWSLVSKKGEFQKGDLCIYFEIDSLLPEHPVFEFVKRGSKKASALRLKTVKLKGVISQGMALPVETIQQINPEFDLENIQEGQDVTEALGVTKYDPTNLLQSSGKDFPGVIQKTDEMRIQSCPEILDELRGKECYITIKLDGCSATYAYYEDEYMVCSRNRLLALVADKANHWWTISQNYQLEQLLKDHPGYAIQGEICGPGIQKNRLGLNKTQFFVFNVWNIEQQRYLNYQEFIDFTDKLGLERVPVLKTTVIDESYSLESLLQLAEGKYPGTKNEREGIVIRPVKEYTSKALEGGRLSCKVISNKFLLKGGE